MNQGKLKEKHAKAFQTLQTLEEGPSDKYEIAEAVDVSPSTAKDKISILRDAGFDVRWSHTHKQYHLGDADLHRDAEDIGNDEVTELLRDGATIQDIADELHTIEGEVTKLFDRLEESGISIKSKGDTFYIPEGNNRRFSLDTGNRFEFGLISDTHLGSSAEHLQELHNYYDKCKDRGIQHVFHCGDISDGWKVHQGQLNVIRDEAAGWGRLQDYVVENYPSRQGITTHFIEGNHDHKFFRRNNIHFGRLIADRRDDLHYCGDSQATFILDREHDIDLELIHPSGGKPYTTGYRLQTLYRERNLHDRPSVAGVGHLHGSMFAETEGVKGLYAGAWKGTTTYGKRKGHQAKVGGWTIDMTIDNGVISEFLPRWHGYAERNTGENFDVEDL
jgi:predicted transcriptional regulator